MMPVNTSQYVQLKSKGSTFGFSQDQYNQHSLKVGTASPIQHLTKCWNMVTISPSAPELCNSDVLDIKYHFILRHFCEMLSLAYEFLGYGQNMICVGGQVRGECVRRAVRQTLLGWLLAADLFYCIYTVMMRLLYSFMNDKCFLIFEHLKKPC